MNKLLHLFISIVLVQTINAQNIGIGTTNPLMKLHVSKPDSAVLLLENTQTLTTNTSNALYFKTGAGSYPYTGAIKTIGQSFNTARLGLFTFAASSPNSLLERLTISDAGNVGIGNTNPNGSALLDISSTTKGFLPPRMTETQRNNIAPVEGLMIYNTTTKKPNYYDGTEWKAFDGTITTYTIGDSYAGGIIAYILLPGDPGYTAAQTHGLIVAPADQSTGTQWGCSNSYIGTSTALGTGNQNTIDIISAGCAGAGTAARICGDLILNGYSDWYLPSKDELNKLFINRVAIGGFSAAYYWASSEIVASDAAIQHLSSGGQFSDLKVGTNRVRAIRAF